MTSIVDALKPCRKHCLSLSPWLTSKYRRIRFETLSLKVGVILALKDVVGRCVALWDAVWRCMALWDAVCSVRNATDIGIRLIFLSVMLALQLYKGLAVSVS